MDGNVLTSQRVTDVVIKAFRTCAASQGDTNNFAFGTGGKSEEDGTHVDGFAYDETIAGGAGADPGWNGQSGVHTLMTNTCITNPEILKAQAVLGGDLGGDGVVREIEFLEPVQYSVLS